MRARYAELARKYEENGRMEAAGALNCARNVRALIAYESPPKTPMGRAYSRGGAGFLEAEAYSAILEGAADAMNWQPSNERQKQTPASSCHGGMAQRQRV